MMNVKRTLPILFLLVVSACSFSQKKPLDHSVYDGWNAIRGTALSNDGRWITYTVAPQEGDAKVEVRQLPDGKTFTIERGSNVQFTNDSKFLLATIVPPRAEVREAQRKKVKAEDMPKNSLLILDLTSGEKTELARVTSFQSSAEDIGWIAYRPEPPKPEPTKPEPPKAEPARAAEQKPEGAEAAKQPEPAKPKKKSDHRVGEVIVLRHLPTGKEERLEDVASYRFSKDGTVFVYSISNKDGDKDGIVWYRLTDGERRPVVTQLGRYTRITLHDDTKRVAFLTDKDDYEAKQPSRSLYLYDPQPNQTRLLAKEGSSGLPQGDWIADANLSFSDKATRVFFNTQSKPAEEEKKDETPEDERVVVDIWHWQDERMMPQQLLQATAERNRSYQAVVHLDSGRIVPLETEAMRSVTVGEKGDGRWAIGRDDKPYRILVSWDTSYSDIYLIDVTTGERTKLYEKVQGGMSFSPGGRYLFGYNMSTGELLAYDLATRTQTDLAKRIPHPIVNELFDNPGNPGIYGIAGWTKDDGRVLVYDQFDIWSVDPSGKAASVNVTGGYGRVAQMRFRYVRIDPEEEYIDPSKPAYFTAFDTRTKHGGYAWGSVGAPQTPRQVVLQPKSFGSLAKAKNADVVTFTQQCFVEFPDVWVAENLNFQNPRKLSNANPQQAEYNWGTAELFTWTSLDGERLQGLLIKPEDFDPAKKYPMIAYFYERSSDGLYSYRTPAPSASTVNLSMYASNGYVMFVPDIPYKIGYPGESAVNAIMPGVTAILDRGFVDPKRVGVQGQSWGGYQTAYLITESNLFAAACAGAPVANMLSAYGGIRWGSGLVRQMQYEKGQSRIDGSIWQQPMRYIENSPLFFLDKVQTPLLIMHNDKDGAVPWYQGIELYAGLRRLGKPVWLVNYNNEDHNLVQRHNRKDWSVRMQQFFDHYLKGAPAPRWLVDGLPATEKGRSMGFDLVPDRN
jgi:dipeptidyl aminopeptidase/acylaminoacyl peptidase